MAAIEPHPAARNFGELAAARSIERPLPVALGTCLLIHDFLSPAECTALIAAAERRGLASAASDYPPSYRNNERQVVDDTALAGRLFERLRDYAPAVITEHDAGGHASVWQLLALNERIRICRYRPGQEFRIHQDGVHHRGLDCRSQLTFMVYLTDGSQFEGGDTLFYAAGPAYREGDRLATPVVARVRPRSGSLILFDHRIWHAGATVTRGCKHILRSDLIYQRAAAAALPARPSAPRPFEPGHDGYVWTLARLSDGNVASGGRDTQIRLWNSAGILQRALNGHRQSVLGLVEARPGVLASVSRDRTLRIWDLDSGACTRTVIAHDAAALAVARLSDGRLATAGADHVVALWTADGDPAGRLSGHSGWIWALAALGSDVLASASEDGNVKLWSTTNAACLASLPGPRPLRTIDAWRAAPAQHAQGLAVGDAAGWVSLWSVDGARAECVRRFKAHGAAVRRVRFLADGTLATCGEDNRLHLWSSCGAGRLYSGRHENFVTDVAECANGVVLSCAYDGTVRPHEAWPRSRHLAGWTR